MQLMSRATLPPPDLVSHETTMTRHNPDTDSVSSTGHDSSTEPDTLSASGGDLLAAFESHCVPLLQLETNQVQDYRRAVKHFQTWWQEANPRSGGPGVRTLQDQPHLLGEFYAAELKKRSPKTASDKHMRLTRVWKLLHECSVLKKGPPPARKKQIRKRLQIDGRGARQYPIPASLDDVDRLLWACLRESDHLCYPVLGDLEPYQFWFNAIAASTFHGCRPGDLWAIKPQHGLGLQWDEISTGTAPPIDGGDSLSADWEFRWLQLRTNKTGSVLVAPISPHLHFLIERCRGLHAERVFPLGQSKKSWYQQMDRIKRRAQLQCVRPYDVSLCGAKPSRSLRKTASVVWKQCVNRAAASHMLAHSVRSGASDDVDEVVSDVTEQHYNGADIFRELVAGAPRVLDQIPAGNWATL